MDVGEHILKVVFEEGSNLNIVHQRLMQYFTALGRFKKQLLMHRRNVYFKCIYIEWEVYAFVN